MPETSPEEFNTAPSAVFEESIWPVKNVPMSVDCWLITDFSDVLNIMPEVVAGVSMVRG